MLSPEAKEWFEAIYKLDLHRMDDLFQMDPTLIESLNETGVSFENTLCFLIAKEYQRFVCVAVQSCCLDDCFTLGR